MLKEFKIKNFRSFKDEIIFTMEADSTINEHPKHLITDIYQNNLLKISAIYGPNAGGKTNLLRAISLLQKLLLTDAIKTDNVKEEITSKLLQPFLFNKIVDNELNISISFITSKYELFYKLGIQLIEMKTNIIYEELICKKLDSELLTTVFIRNKENMSGLIMNEFVDQEMKLTSDMPFINYFYTDYYHKEIKSSGIDIIRIFITELQSIEYMQIHNNIDYYNLINNFMEKFLAKEEYNHKITKLFQKLDIPIKNVYLDKEKNSIFIEYQFNGIRRALPYLDESEGTRMLIYLLAKTIMNIDNGKIFLIDEIDSHLHPAIIRKIIELYNSNYNKHSQLIFTTHDIWNMNNENYRKDEIWFAYRKEDLSTQLISLSDFINYKGEKISSDSLFSKLYMEGKFGTDPIITKGVLWDE